MESGGTSFLTSIRAEDRGARLPTEITLVIPELMICEEEVVEFMSCVILFLSIKDLLSPHCAVNMHELVDLEGNKATCNLPFTIETAQKTLDSLLRVIDQNVFLLTEFDIGLLIIAGNVCS